MQNNADAGTQRVFADRQVAEIGIDYSSSRLAENTGELEGFRGEADAIGDVDRF